MPCSNLSTLSAMQDSQARCVSWHFAPRSWALPEPTVVPRIEPRSEDHLWCNVCTGSPEWLIALERGVLEGQLRQWDSSTSSETLLPLAQPGRAAQVPRFLRYFS